MKSREIQGGENTRWQCVQAFTLTNHNAADKAEQASRQPDGMVDVVCTPSGGAQTVRLKLADSWESALSDDELEKHIQQERRLLNGQ